MWIDINKNNILRKEEKEMENKKLVVKGTEMEVVDGKVVISSEELAAAIQTQQIDLGAEEEANIDINIRGVQGIQICSKKFIVNLYIVILILIRKRLLCSYLDLRQI